MHFLLHKACRAYVAGAWEFLKAKGASNNRSASHEVGGTPSGSRECRLSLLASLFLAQCPLTRTLLISCPIFLTSPCAYLTGWNIPQESQKVNTEMYVCVWEKARLTFSSNLGPIFCFWAWSRPRSYIQVLVWVRLSRVSGCE